jgi:hypothetical protein
MANVLCLCPNDHVRFDLGAIWLDDQLQVVRKVSTSVRQVDQGFVVLTASSVGWLIQAAVGSFGGAGGLRTNRSGWAA